MLVRTLGELATGFRAITTGFRTGLHGCVVLECLALRSALIALPGASLGSGNGSRTEARHDASRATRSAGGAKLQAPRVVAVAVDKMLRAMVDVPGTFYETVSARPRTGIGRTGGRPVSRMFGCQ